MTTAQERNLWLLSQVNKLIKDVRSLPELPQQDQEETEYVINALAIISDDLEDAIDPDREWEFYTEGG